jgi:signal transduction histidine kinase
LPNSVIPWSVSVRSGGYQGAGGASATGGTGLRGLADRVALLDGTFDVISPDGEGTLVRARIPL